MNLLNILKKHFFGQDLYQDDYKRAWYYTQEFLTSSESCQRSGELERKRLGIQLTNTFNTVLEAGAIFASVYFKTPELSYCSLPIFEFLRHTQNKKYQYSLLLINKEMEIRREYLEHLSLDDIQEEFDEKKEREKLE